MTAMKTQKIVTKPWIQQHDVEGRSDSSTTNEYSSTKAEGSKAVALKNASSGCLQTQLSYYYYYYLITC